MSKRILITNAGAGPANNLMRSLAQADSSAILLGCHSDRFVLKLSRAQRNFLLPPRVMDGPGVDTGFEGALRALMEHAGVDLVIPGNDRDARALAAIQEERPLPCRTFLPALRAIDLCQDKYVLSCLLRERGIPAPRTIPLTDRDAVESAWRELAPRDLAWCRIRRGFASRGATKVRSAEQAWHWISYWNTMRGVPVEEFTLCEFLPGRDYNAQALWADGRLVLTQMCERLSYLNADQHASGMASTPALAKTVWVPAVIEACEAAVRALQPRVQGVFSIDLKENEEGVPCITEINAGRFAMITSFYDVTGRHNMAGAYLRLGFDEKLEIGQTYEDPGECYLVRELDTLPGIFHADELFQGIETVSRSAHGASVDS